MLLQHNESELKWTRNWTRGERLLQVFSGVPSGAWGGMPEPNWLSMAASTTRVCRTSPLQGS